jgi:hypothetical protein
MFRDFVHPVGKDGDRLTSDMRFYCDNDDKRSQIKSDFKLKAPVITQAMGVASWIICMDMLHEVNETSELS